MTEALFHILNCIVNDKELNNSIIAKLSESEWFALYEMGKRQGITAILFEKIQKLPKEIAPPKELAIKWMSHTLSIEKQIRIRWHKCREFANLMHHNKIDTILIKGISCSLYYPNPLHREFGDLDCYLGEKFEQGNLLCEQEGYSVNRYYYKDSAINYHGMLVENHRFFLPIRGNRKMKELEKHLRSIVVKQDMTYVTNSHLILPTPDFNALFLTMHALNHFLNEGIKLRFILDWCFFLKKEQNNINWEEFYMWCDKMHLSRFTNALTAISVKYFGLKITNLQIVTTSPYADRILEDTLYVSEGIYNKGYSLWKGRYVLLKNKLSFGWKYHTIYQKSIIAELFKYLYGYITEKYPKL